MAEKNPKILLVEDDPFFAELYSAKLLKEGFFVILADDEREGFEKAIVEKPKFILLDISLPEHEDLGLLKKIKNNDKTKKIKVLVISDQESETEKQEAFSWGADDHMVRADDSADKVADRIRSLINNNKKK